MGSIGRRSFLSSVAAGLAGAAAGCRSTPGEGEPPDSPVPAAIDTHVHFYDPSRPGGVPWPPEDDPVLYRTVLPPDYRALPVPSPVAGVVVVEASPLVEDNAWVLGLARRDPLILGVVGNLPVGTPEFASLLDRFAADPLFRGIRIRDPMPPRGMDDPAVLADLRRLAARGLVLDLVHGWGIFDRAAVLAEAIPDLTIVIDHLGDLAVDGKAPPAGWIRVLERAAGHPRIACKVSGLVEGTGRTDGSAPGDLHLYEPVLAAVWDAFGPDRLVYGSNWPVSGRFAPLGTVQSIVLEFCRRKGGEAAGKVLAGNARRIYTIEPPRDSR